MQTTHSIFSKQEVNTKRQPELDLLKAVTIFFMIFIHVTEVIFSKEWEDMFYCNLTTGWQVLYIVINAVAAFGFMFSMGTAILYSRFNNARSWIIRGFQLILAWLVLRLFYVYPLAKIFASEHGMSIPEFILCVICSSDILFFAGTFFLFIGIHRKLKIGMTGMIISAVVLFIVGHFVSYNPDSILMQYILGNFIITDNTFFPFINWIMAPVLGMCWGKILLHCTNKDRLYLITGIIGAIGTGIILLVANFKGLLTTTGLEQLTDVQVFYNANILTVTIACCFLALLLSLYYAITKFVKATWFTNSYTFLSKQLTKIYFVQWIIIPWLALCLPRPTKKENPWWGILIAVFVMGASVLLALVDKKIKNAKESKKEN